ncbi:MAG: 3-oxoadipate CoA-transferase, partial [Acidovorax sp.]|nr:3-oxoadipate CoA-transferase [Acidovorax sp.]
QGLRLIDTVPGLSHEELERIVGLPIQPAQQ